MNFKSNIFYIAFFVQKTPNYAQKENIDGVLTAATDYGVLSAAYIAEKMNLQGLNYEAAKRIKNKYAVRKCLFEAKVDDTEQAFEVNENFNAIGSCVRKEYTYTIYNSRLKDPFFVNRAWFYPKHLDERIMQAAASQFVGTHDFAAVRSVGTDVKSTVRTVYYYNVERKGNIIELKVCANGFLYNMARAMAGTVIYAAEGKIKPEEIGAILDSGNRTAAGPTVPPGGLYMTHLWYDDGNEKFEVANPITF